MADHLFLSGFHEAGDGGGGLWHRSSTLGVRGKATVTNQGAGLPDGDYRVLLTGGGGTGGSARVAITGGKLNVFSPSWSTGADDDLPDALILEPGSGYTSPPALSTSGSDWRQFYNGLAVTFPGTPTFPVVTFASSGSRAYASRAQAAAARAPCSRPGTRAARSFSTSGSTSAMRRRRGTSPPFRAAWASASSS
jgi:hypothetical protein